MKKDYCEYCHFKDFTGLADYGEKPLLRCTSKLFGSNVDLEVFIEHGKICLDNTAFGINQVSSPYIKTKPINYCPMCGEKFNHQGEER